MTTVVREEHRALAARQATRTSSHRGGRPRPRTLSGAVHPKCGCPDCYAGHAREARDRHRQRAEGTWQPFVDAAPVRAHVEQLHADGLPYAQIGRLARVSIETIRNLRKQRAGAFITSQMRQEIAEALMGVQIDLAAQSPHVRQPVRAAMPSRGSTRRIQALRAIGWPVYALAQHSRLSSATLIRLPGEKWTETGTHRRIRELYEALHDQSPAACGVPAAAVARSINYARKQGWAVPTAWTNIDTDRQASARFTAPVYAQAPRGHRQQAVVDDTAELAQQGTPRDTIAERLGLSWAAIARAHERAGVLLPLALREPG